MRIRTVALTIGTLAGGATAIADTVDLRFTGTGAGRNVKFNLNGDSLNVFAGQLIHEASDGTGRGAGLDGELVTFCTDLLEHVTNSDRTYTLEDPADVPGPVGMGQQRADALSDIYAWAGGAQSVRGVNSDFAAAFQVAIWEIAYDYDGATRASLDLGTGDLTVTRTNGSALSSTILSHVGDLFDAIGAVGARNGMELVALANDGAQDQLVDMPAVPLPGAAAMAAVGLAGLGVRRRR